MLPTFSFTARDLPDEHVVALHGELDVASVDGLTDALVDVAGSTLVLDLSDLKHTDSMGLGTLVRLYVSAKSAGCSLELLNLSKQIQHLLGITNMLSVFTVIGENGIKWM